MTNSINQLIVVTGNDDYMPTLHEIFERRTSSQEEYDRLYNSDNLYIAWAKKKDDAKLDEFVNAIAAEYYSWAQALVGNSKSASKLKNDESDTLLQGHVFSVTTKQMDLFEKVALMPSMKYGYRFDKYDINDLKEKEKQAMLDALSKADESD
jgi:hypothetical protein